MGSHPGGELSQSGVVLDWRGVTPGGESSGLELSSGEKNQSVVMYRGPVGFDEFIMIDTRGLVGSHPGGELSQSGVVLEGSYSWWGVIWVRVVQWGEEPVSSYVQRACWL